jgi:hypothetical protein
MIEAERVLLRHALRDSFNHRFVFLSDSFFGFFSAAYLCTVSATRITTSCQHQLVSLIALQIQKIAVIILE